MGARSKAVPDSLGAEYFQTHIVSTVFRYRNSGAGDTHNFLQRKIRPKFHGKNSNNMCSRWSWNAIKWQSNLVELIGMTRNLILTWH